MLGFSSSSAVSERLISLSSHPITAQSAHYYFSLGGRIRPHKSAKREERQSYNHAVLFYCRTATNSEFLSKASGPHLTGSAGVSQRYHSHLCSMVTESQNLYSVNNNKKGFARDSGGVLQVLNTVYIPKIICMSSQPLVRDLSSPLKHGNLRKCHKRAICCLFK